MLIYSNCSKKELEDCRRKIVKKLDADNQIEDIPCSVAIGSAWGVGSKNIEALVEEADQCMYINKRLQKGKETQGCECSNDAKK